jgi:segregation and condensation protein A
MRLAAQWLTGRPQLGLDIFRRGAAEDLTETDRSRLKLDLPSLVRAYLAALRRAGAAVSYRPRPVTLWTLQDALARLHAMLGGPEWLRLEDFLPDPPVAGDVALHRRAAVASTLLASLELARGGAIRLRQDADFGPILLRQAAEPVDS